MEFIVTKNNLVDLNVFFYKKGYINIHKPLISLLKVDSVAKVTPAFHLGFDKNMGFLKGNKIYSGVMVFEVLEGYPLQSIMFKNNKNNVKNKTGKEIQQSLEDLEIMDFYCIQKRNQDAFGDFVLKNLKFIDTKMTQSTEDIARRIIATFVCSDKIPFRFPFFFNEFISDCYSSHLVRKSIEIDNIVKDLTDRYSVEFLTDKLLVEYYKLLNNVTFITPGKRIEIDDIVLALQNTYKDAVREYIYKMPLKKKSPIYRIRDFIARFYKIRNEYVYNHMDEKGNLDFLKLLDINVNDMISKSEQ